MAGSVVSTADAADSGCVHRSSIQFRWAAGTDVGKVRRVNEDAFFARSGFFAVADGMGGHAAGDVASALAIGVCTEESAAVPLPIEAVEKLVNSANEAVYRHARDVGPAGMGTTLVGLVAVDNAGQDSLVVFNVGDSRCYSVSVDGLVQVTRDHSLVQEMIDEGRLSVDDAQRHPDRNVVTRAIGVEPNVAADFFVVPPGSAHRLVLCSDGVHGQVAEAGFAKSLVDATSPEEAVSTTIDLVLSGAAADNATIVVIDVDWPEAVDDETAVDDDVTGPRTHVRDAELIDTVPIDRAATLPVHSPTPIDGVPA